MRTVGRRKEQPITFSASAKLLATGARFNDELQKLATGNTRFIPKGLYRFRNHQNANQHSDRHLIEGMARAALERHR